MCIKTTTVLEFCGLALLALLASTSADTIPIAWTKEGAAEYPPSSPLNVRVNDVLQLECSPSDNESRVVQLQDESILQQCSNSSEITIPSCLPGPLTDCLNPEPQFRITGGSGGSCNIPSFERGQIYHLASLKRNPDRCLFALTVRVCSNDSDWTQPPSRSPSPSLSPSPSTTVTATNSDTSSLIFTSSVTPSPTSRSHSPHALQVVVWVCALHTLWTNII